MKRLLVGLLLLGMVVSGSACSVFDSTPGTYIVETGDTAGVFITILDDGTCYGVLNFHGNWMKSGNRITITSAIGTEYFTIEGNNLRSDPCGGNMFGWFCGGDLYIKQ